MSELTRTALAIEADLLEKFDSWMAGHGYDNRSEAMRDLIRKTLIEQQWENSQADVIAVLSIVYDHASRALAQDLTHRQHERHGAVLCSQHVHLDEHNCLEAIIMQGKAAHLRELTDGIIASHGVKIGRLTLLSKNI